MAAIEELRSSEDANCEVEVQNFEKVCPARLEKWGDLKGPKETERSRLTGRECCVRREYFDGSERDRDDTVDRCEKRRGRYRRGRMDGWGSQGRS